MKGVEDEGLSACRLEQNAKAGTDQGGWSSEQ